MGSCVFESLRVRDTPARDHPVHFARLDRLLGANTVAVHDLAREQIGDGREPDVRMGSHIHAPRDATLKVDGTEMVEENEGADHSAPCEGENPPDLQAVTQVAAALIDHEFGHPANAQPWRLWWCAGSCVADRPWGVTLLSTFALVLTRIPHRHKLRESDEERHRGR